MPRNRENTHLAAPARKPKTDGRHATLTPRILGSPSRGDCTSGRKLVPEFRGHFQIAEGFVPIWTNRCRANRLFYITLGHAGETFLYPKCSFLVPRRLDTNLGYLREVRGSCHLCGGRPL